MRRWVLATIWMLCAGLVWAQAPGYEGDPKFQKEVAAAKAPRQFLDDQIGHWRKADKIAGGQCLACAMRVLELEYRRADLKQVMAAADEMERRTAAPAVWAQVETMRGAALFHANREKPKPEQLVAADQAFQTALAKNPGGTMARYLDGRTLALLHRDEEARAAFETYVSRTKPDDRYRTRASHFAANPALAREKMAPPFTVHTADGKEFTLDDMGGRVVLVDFWATWCGPCNAELPHMKQIAKDFAGQPFVLISVSWDKDEAKWQEFVAKNEMTWNQFRDADHTLSEAYGVDAIPHYFTIDADGVLQNETLGSGSNIEGRLRKLVARAKAASEARGAEETATVRSGERGSE